MPPLGNDFHDVLREFDDDEPIITDEDRQSIGALFEIVHEEIKNVTHRNGLCVDSLVDDVVQRKGLQRVANSIKTVYKAQKKFLDCFPEWKSLRVQSIKLLKDTGNSIITDRKNCNISRIVGATASFVGGGILIASAVSTPLTFGLSAPLAVAGATITGAGNTTALGTSIAESLLLRKKVHTAKQALEDDKKRRKFMDEWVTHSRESMAAIDDVIGWSLMQEMLQDFQAFHGTAQKTREAFKSGAWNRYVANFVARFVNNPQAKFSMEHVPLIISLVYATFLIRSKNILKFDSIFWTFRMLSNACILLDIGVDSACAMLSLARGGKEVSQTVGRAVLRGGLAALGMAVDVALIAVTSIDMKNGSKSKHAQSLFDAAEQLEQEMNLYVDVYNKLKNDEL